MQSNQWRRVSRNPLSRLDYIFVLSVMSSNDNCGRRNEYRLQNHPLDIEKKIGIRMMKITLGALQRSDVSCDTASESNEWLFVAFVLKLITFDHIPLF